MTTTKSLKHVFTSAITPGGDATIVRPSEWNAEHVLWFGRRDVNGATDTILHNDHLSVVTYLNTGTAVTVPAPAGGSMPAGWHARYKYIGNGTAVFTGSGGATINGAASLTLFPNQTIDLISDGTVAYIGIITEPPQLRFTDSGMLKRSTATLLTFTPYRGDLIKINGQLYPIPVGSIVGLGNTSVFVNGTTGQNLANGTVYWIFAFINAGVVTADFRTAATHVTDTSPGNAGVEILTGNSTRTLIGMCRTNASAQFVDTEADRHLRSWFHDRGAIFKGAPLNGLSTSYSGGFDHFYGTTTFLKWADELVDVSVTGSGYMDATDTMFANISIDGIGYQSCDFTAADANYEGALSCRYVNSDLAEGYHTAQTACQTNGITGYFYIQVMGVLHGAR